MKRKYTYVTLVNGNVWENVWAVNIRAARRQLVKKAKKDPWFRRNGIKIRKMEVVTWRAFFNQP